MLIDASCKQVGGSRQAQGCQVTAVGLAPQADPIGVYIGPSSQVNSGSKNVAELAGSGSAVMQSLTELHPVADSAVVVDGENDKASIGEILIEGITVVVIA